jgi:hypothetical protein
MINIDSEQGRIGELWWINSDPQPVSKLVPLVIGMIDFGIVVKQKLIRWGTFGFGRNISITMEPIDD